MRSLSRRHVLRGSLAVAGLGLFPGCGTLPLQALQPTNMPRVGYLSASGAKTQRDRLEAFRNGMRELSYVEGRNFAFEERYAEGNAARIPELARELVQLPVNIILSAAPVPTRAAREATSTIPIVMAYDFDPVGNGFVASLGRPGGTITGLSSLAPNVSAKQLEILKEIKPGLTRVAVLGTSTPGVYPDLTLDPRFQDIERAAGTLGVQVQIFDIQVPGDINVAFSQASNGHADAAIVLSSFILGTTNQARIVEQAAQSGVPTIYFIPEFVHAGGLMSYGADWIDLYRRSATFVAKILKGANPAELPVEQPTIFGFVINLRTAQTLGLTVPQSILQQATEIIQ